MTNSRGTSAVTIAEHTIAVTLALLRSLPLAWRRQSERSVGAARVRIRPGAIDDLARASAS